VLRVVLDVNVLVSSLIRRSGVPASVVDAWRGGYFEVVVSARLLAELRDVLGRAHLARYMASAEAEKLFVALERNATLVEDPPLAERVVPGDPDDDYLVALARTGRAHVIVSGDTDLLEADIEPPALSPRAFLARLAEIP
jgi:putative PIN family toxin of toxin-antitoxin system